MAGYVTLIQNFISSDSCLDDKVQRAGIEVIRTYEWWNEARHMESRHVARYRKLHLSALRKFVDLYDMYACELFILQELDECAHSSMESLPRMGDDALIEYFSL